MLLVAEIFVPIFDVIHTALFRTRLHASFVLTNALRVGNAEQVRHLVSIGCIRPLCDLLAVHDLEIVMAALSAIACLLQHGRVEQTSTGRENPYKSLIEECGGI